MFYSGLKRQIPDNRPDVKVNDGLVAGLCGCEKNLFPEIDLANNLEGSWEKVYPEGVQDAGLVIWTFSTINKESQDPFILTIYVSDVFSGDSEAKYIYQQHQNGYPGVGSSTPEIYLFEIDHDFMQEDRKAAYTPAARYYVKECSKDKLVLTGNGIYRKHHLFRKQFVADASDVQDLDAGIFGEGTAQAGDEDLEAAGVEEVVVAP